MIHRVNVGAAFAQALQTAYAIWVVSKPLLPWVPWIGLGVGLAILTQLHDPMIGLLRRLGVAGTLNPGQDPPERPRAVPKPSLASFLYRNYGLHVTAVFALLGADRLGSLALLGTGACVDALREQSIVLNVVTLGRGESP